MLVIAAAQFASGGDRLYPWQTTDAGSVVGMFANRNHFATFCLVSLPFAAVIGARLSVHKKQGFMSPWTMALLIGLITVFLGVIRSRAGIVLAVPVLGASFAAAWIAAGRGTPRPAILIALGATAGAALLVSIFALGPILERFDTVGEGNRLANWPIVVEASQTYLPVGSGLGSFDAIFRSVEPLETLDGTFFNQAHNDYLEVWLETGWLGAALLGLFLFWYLKRSRCAWTSSSTSDRNLQRAASIAIAAILAHSVVDYPLRTETLAVVFAVCCGILEFAGLPDQRQERATRSRSLTNSDRASRSAC